MLDSSAIGFGASDGIRIRDQELGKHANRSETVADQRSWPIPEHPLPSRSVGQPSLWTPDGHPCASSSAFPRTGTRRRDPREDSPSSISAPARRLVRRMKRTLIPLAVLVTFAWSASAQTHE